MHPFSRKPKRMVALEVLAHSKYRTLGFILHLVQPTYTNILNKYRTLESMKFSVHRLYKQENKLYNLRTLTHYKFRTL